MIQVCLLSGNEITKMCGCEGNWEFEIARKPSWKGIQCSVTGGALDQKFSSLMNEECGAIHEHILIDRMKVTASCARFECTSDWIIWRIQVCWIW